MIKDNHQASGQKKDEAGPDLATLFKNNNIKEYLEWNI